jgi:hypothetical protein
MSREPIKHIKTWKQRCEEHPDHQEKIISERMIQERMQEEIDELRQALIMFQQPTKIFGPNLEEILNSAGFYRKREWVGLTADEIWKCNKSKSDSVEFHICYAHQNVEDFAEAIEAKLKEKNA